MKLANIIGVLLLIIGVAAGVLLVQNVQQFREKAKEHDFFVICHQTDGNFETLKVNEQELKEHIDHRDMLGECNDEPKL